MRISCMGGWGCQVREKCRLYVNTAGRHIVERLCDHGATDSFEPIRVVRQIGDWERRSIAKNDAVAPALWGA